MARTIGRGILAGVLVLALLFPQPAAQACGPFFSEPVFVTRLSPIRPLKSYAQGELGILQPSYMRMYLAAAYRQLSDAPFSKAEREQLLSLWGEQATPENDAVWRNDGQDPEEKWLEAAGKITGSNDAQAKKKAQSIFFRDYGSCLEDAYRTATQTLAQRVKEFGAESPAVRSWTEAQQQVFANCHGQDRKMEHVFPREAEEGLPTVIRADRAYQIAAAHFYAQNWNEAEQRFQRISQDQSSPWKDIAALVAVRCLIRQGTLNEDKKASQAQLVEASDRLRQLEANPSLQNLRPAISRLRGFVDFRANPAQRLAELSHLLEKASSPSGLRLDLIDYTWLLDRALGEDYSAAEESNPEARVRLREELANLLHQGGITDWILTFQGRAPDSHQHALDRWKQTHSPAWLVAALSKAKADEPAAAELMQAAGEVLPASSAYLTAAYHRARLLAEGGREAQAREEADKLLALPAAKRNDAARNQILALRMKLAVNFDEFLRFSPRRAVSIVYDEEVLPDDQCRFLNETEKAKCNQEHALHQLLDADAALAFTEGLPTELLTEAAESKSLPENLLKRIALAAWVRAVLLGDEKNVLRLAGVVAHLEPGLAEDLKTYQAAESGDARRFAAVFLLLRNPGLRPFVEVGMGRSESTGQTDSLRDNWWCSLGPRAADNYEWNYYTMFTQLKGPLGELYPGQKTVQPTFLTAAQRSAASEQWKTLASLPAAPAWLGAEAMAFAKSHPEDERIPEALHRVVRASRFGCNGKDKENPSKEAFQLLHRRYPQSEWTRKTPYWY